MAIKISNTLTGKKELFKPIRKGKVGIYVCGPTVYDQPHIGHLRSAYVFEVIRRYFVYRGYKLKFVKNITDIDDKIIEKAKEELKNQKPDTRNQTPDLKEKVKEIAEKYLDKYHQAMEAFGITPADIEPKATEHIGQMLKAIDILLEKGFAYRINGDVYFAVRKFSRYGRLSRQSIEDLISGARIEADKRKRDPLDFVLWKRAKENEPSWESPWGAGRPGWHIECSTMSTQYLGNNFDIHGGGKDLIFPHHENEIAQAEAFTGEHFANYWVHNGLLTINGEKMSKSSGNFISLDKALCRYSPEVLKLFFLTTHYSHPADFSYKKMDETERARERFYILLEKIDSLVTSHQSPVTSKRIRLSSEVKDFHREFIKAMDDDFNTPRAMAALFALVNFAHKNFTNKEIIQDARNLLLDLGKVFGLFEQAAKETIATKLPAGFDAKTILELIEKRNRLRKGKEFQEADKIRKDLEKAGIVLEDGQGRTTWRLRT